MVYKHASTNANYLMRKYVNKKWST